MSLVVGINYRSADGKRFGEIRFNVARCWNVTLFRREHPRDHRIRTSVERHTRRTLTSAQSLCREYCREASQ